MLIHRQRWARWASAAAAALVLGAGSATWADNVVADGDGATPVTGSGLSFGTVCLGAAVTKPALVGVQRNGSSGGPNVFANGATVTVSVTAVTGAGVSTTPGSGAIGTITLPSNWSAQPNTTVTGALSLPVRLVATATGTVSGSVSLAAAAGSVNRATTLPVSATVVACDTTAPVLHLPGPLTVEATAPGGTAVTYPATADDENPAHPTVTCDHPSGATFPLGDTTVRCSATDAAGNTGTGQFTVTVVDTVGPVIQAVADITGVEATGPDGAAVTYRTPTAADAVAGTVPVSCSPASGTDFPLGTTTVTCTATDGHGNSSRQTFDVTVQDTQAPVLAVPADITAEATSGEGADVTYPAPSAQDAVDGAVTPACAPASGSSFPLGATEVTCTATDSAHNTATATFAVTVVDTTPPAITGTPADITTEATGPSGAAVSFAAPTATDLVDGAVAVDCAPPSGGSFPVGTTTVTCSARTRPATPPAPRSRSRCATPRRRR
ncbi:HYR domain-containing protein [Catellatospora coxensis]